MNFQQCIGFYIVLITFSFPNQLQLSQSTYIESELLFEVAQGNETAFKKLFEKWHQQLGRHIFNIIKSPELTQEIVQDVFVKIWQTRESLTEIRNFSDYLFIVTRNQAISVLRKLMLEQQRRNEWENVATLHDLQTEETVKNLKLSLIDAAIAQLSPQQQKCFILSRHERLTYEEIAIKLGIGKESVKTHISLAVASITRYVKSEMDRVLLLLWLLISLN